MRYKDLEAVRTSWLNDHWTYKRSKWNEFDYFILNNVLYKKKTGKGRIGTYNDVIIAADTETSKPEGFRDFDDAGNPIANENHICAWTITIRFFHRNIATLYGSRPSEMMAAFNNIRAVLKGDDIFVYFHNLSFDQTFLRRFFYREWGFPSKQLNTKPHYPVQIRFKNGYVIKDSLILAGCKLEKWAKDLDVEHKKAVGYWDYDRIRNQDWIDNATEEELIYIENDTLALAECIDALMASLGKSIYSICLTMTGIPREEVRKRAKANRGHENFKRQAPDWDLYNMMVRLYHGGYSHANPYFIQDILKEKITEGWDFASSYPFCLLSERYPCTKFTKHPRKEDPDFILRHSDQFAFLFKVTFINIRMKDDLEPMSPLQASKCKHTINARIDNGRIRSCGFCEMEMCEQDLIVINEFMEWDIAECENIYTAVKDYLPRWFTDYVFELFEAKCILKSAKPFDPVLYMLSKMRLNSLYGLCVTSCVKPEIIEVTEPGLYKINKEGDTAFFQSGTYRENFDKDLKEEYRKYVNRKNSVLSYVTGIYVTAYAFKNLFLLGSCVKRVYRKDGRLLYSPHWYYSDTDSAYSDEWDHDLIDNYNQICKNKLRANGYGPVIVDDKEYWLGVAEHKPGEDDYEEFKVLGSKRYAGRNAADHQLHITVAGVPKIAGALCLDDDLNNFDQDFVFPGEETGKLTHYYIFDDIHIDKWGNEVADSIDLKPCDYLLDPTEKWEYIEGEEFTMNIADTEVTDLYEL